MFHNRIYSKILKTPDWKNSVVVGEEGSIVFSLWGTARARIKEALLQGISSVPPI